MKGKILLSIVVLSLLLSSSVLAADGYKIAFLNSSNANAWRIQMLDDMEAVVADLKEEGKISKYSVFVANWDPTLQGQQMLQCINSGYDAIIINPCSDTALNPIIDKALAKGIVVMGVTSTIRHPEIINMTTDRYEWGRIGAEYVVEQINGKGNLLQFDAKAGVSANELAANAFEDVVSHYPDIKILKQVNADWDNGKAKQLMSTLLQAYPDFDAILTQDGTGSGIIAALREANHEMPKAMGTADTWVAYLRLWDEVNKDNPDDPLNTIVAANPPGMGAGSIKVAVNLLEGKEFKDGFLSPDPLSPQNVNTILLDPPIVVTQDNLDEWLEKTADKPDSYYLDKILTDEEVNSFFK